MYANSTMTNSTMTFDEMINASLQNAFENVNAYIDAYGRQQVASVDAQTQPVPRPVSAQLQNASPWLIAGAVGLVVWLVIKK